MRDESSLRRAVSGAVGSGIGGRILAAHAVAARFYRAQLIAEDGTTARTALGRIGVPIDGPWAVGYAPDRPTAVVNELRRQGFDDAEIRASGLASTSKSGLLVDRFRDRVMVGVQGSVAGEQGVVAFVGYRPPGVSPDVPAIVYGPASAIHRPNATLFGVREQAERVGGAAVIANDPLEAMIVAGQTVDAPLPPLVVTPAGPTLTPTHVEELGRVADPAAEVTVTVRPGQEGNRAAGRAYTLLSSAPEHPERGRRLLAVRRYGDLRDVRALAEFTEQSSPGKGLTEQDSLALPKRARPVPGVEGYHSILDLKGTTVYGPDNARRASSPGAKRHHPQRRRAGAGSGRSSARRQGRGGRG
jgi:DNA primase catalytic core, N-terminal domain